MQISNTQIDDVAAAELTHIVRTSAFDNDFQERPHDADRGACTHARGSVQPQQEPAAESASAAAEFAAAAD